MIVCTHSIGLHHCSHHCANHCVAWSQEELFLRFAEFEERVKEPERARAIYKYALDNIPRTQADAVYRRFAAFEKQHGDREGIEVCHLLLV